ncbi:MAG: hypothetical protein ACR2O0_15555 [Rhizobiaceae bacterium]
MPATAGSKLLGRATVPIIYLEHLSEAAIRAYVIADNRLAEIAGWDEELLSIEMQELSGLDLDFDLTVTGFEMPEIDLLISGNDKDLINEAEDEPPPLEDARGYAAGRYLADRSASAHLRRCHALRHLSPVARGGQGANGIYRSTL